MMGTQSTQERIFHTVRIEELVPEDHPLRAIRKLINTDRIRELCRDLYCSDNGRPSVPPEQLFLAMLGGYLMGVRSDRKLIMELKCNMAFRWFVGLDIDSEVWDASTFSKNREHRFDDSAVLETLFEDTVREAMKRGWVSTHWSVDGTLVRADASHKSFVPIEVMQSPEQYRESISGRKKAERLKKKDDDDRGNPTVDWRGEKRSNQTHRSTTDPDARIAKKASHETAIPAYTVNGVMENRNRILVGIGVETWASQRSEREGALRLIAHAREELGLRPKSIGGDKAYFEKEFLRALFRCQIDPHISTMDRPRDPVHSRVKMRVRGKMYQWSQRVRKKIEELWGEAKEEHGFRRFMRRTLENVRQEALMIGWLLNLKRIARLQGWAVA